ncbi:MAG: YdeI/OmpD-associated family protein [Chitinophagaceae bacterium]
MQKNHEKEAELLVGFYKVGSGIPSITWPQSVDEALCFGWIDGVRKSFDKDSYTVRFTPRKITSIRSTININKAEELIKQGSMLPAGLEIYAGRNKERTKMYSFENDAKKLIIIFEKKFKANKKAWKFFIAQAPSYQKTTIHWIMTAKQEVTQLSRLDKVIGESEQQKRLL